MAVVMTSAALTQIFKRTGHKLDVSEQGNIDNNDSAQRLNVRVSGDSADHKHGQLPVHVEGKHTMSLID